jgi:hypothetical protein
VDWTFTRHALERALDMALDAYQIKVLLERPQVTQPSGANYPDGYEVWAHTRIAAVVIPVDRVVVTFLWRGVVYERGTDSEPFRDNN